MSAKTKAPPCLALLRYSLVVVWLATAFVSVLELHGQSLDLLAKLPQPLQRWATTVVLAGAAVDAAHCVNGNERPIILAAARVGLW